MADFRVVAIISAFNEADVISPVIEHLVENGVDVYLIDNRSTDGTNAAAKHWLRKGLLGIEQFPAEAPPGDGPPPFDWEAILKRKEALAKELSADWFIHHDADEFREAPWPGMKLRDAIRWVDRLGYNCIDFRVLNFPPLENGFRPGADPREHFTHWEDPVVYDTLQRKCWKAQKTPVSLAASGGHEAQFPGRRIFPIRFLLRHYPIRSQEHGLRKVFDERKKRFVDKERAKGWHVQYDTIASESHSFLGDPANLHEYDPDRIRLELMLDSEPVRKQEVTAALKHEAEKHAANLEKDREKLTSHLIERERHIANLETLKGEAERRAATLEEGHREIAATLGERDRQVSNLKAELAELRRHASGLEHARETISAHARQTELHAANLQSRMAELERHASGLEGDRGKLAAHVAHLEKVITHLEEIRVDQDHHVARLEELRAAREAEAAGAAARLAELERHAAGLERDRETLAAHISHLEDVRVEKDRHITARDRHIAELNEERVERAELEGRRLALESRLEEMTARERDLEDRYAAMRNRANREEGLRTDAENRAEQAEGDLEAMRRSTIWRMTAPVRWVLDRLKGLFR
jgi:glycosyl transferase family 2